MSKTSMSIRLDSEVKEQAQQVFNHLGMDMTTAINIFLRQAIQYQGLPFDVRIDDNRKLLQVVTDVDQNRNKIRYHKQFKKDFKLAMRRGLKADLLEEVLHFLIQEKELPVRYRDHQLTNSKHFQGVRECHIQPDWLLVYKVDKDELILNLLRTGSHSDLF